MNRAADITLASCALVATAPLIGAACLLVAAFDGLPVFFVQKRVGFARRPFRIFKMRTMQDGSVTTVGGLLRATGVDELPQLLNVLRGDMSLVGPRPLLPEYLPLYTATQARRHEVRPGITGWAAVNGRNGSSWEERLAQDTWYVDHRSLALDLLILARTIGVVVGRRGVVPAGRASAEPFRGRRGPA